MNMENWDLKKYAHAQLYYWKNVKKNIDRWDMFLTAIWCYVDRAFKLFQLLIRLNAMYYENLSAYICYIYSLILLTHCSFKNYIDWNLMVFATPSKGALTITEEWGCWRVLPLERVVPDQRGLHRLHHDGSYCDGSAGSVGFSWKS